jgi:tRNA-splicing ligase RtcB (3'-phosphate/5'-hydroxy nucleic acid ligase)
VRWQHATDCPHAAVLLPADFPVEAKALKQLANLATIRHPAGGEVRCLCATPDFHPGDAGVPIGTILATKNQVIPAAVGSDINCGMRMHVVDLSVDRFLAQRDRFVELLKGDFFFGTRDVTMAATTMQALFRDGILGWLDRTMSQPMGSIVGADLNQIAAESDRIFQQGSLSGNIKWVPPELVPENGLVRDGGLATIGGGNHFKA